VESKERGMHIASAWNTGFRVIMSVLPLGQFILAKVGLGV
jgi:hypothetical protein